MLINFEVTSPCQGVVEQVLIQKDGCIHEGEPLFVIQLYEEKIPIFVKFRGRIKQIEVQPGDSVIPGMILAFIQEEIMNHRTGND